MVLGWTRNPGRRSAFPHLSRSLLKRTIGNFQRKYSWVLISSIFAPTGLLYVPSQHSEAWILIIYHPFPRPFLAYVMNCQILIVLQWHGLRINPFAKFWQYYIQCFILLFTKVNVLEEGSVKLLPRDLVALGCSALTSSVFDMIEGALRRVSEVASHLAKFCTKNLEMEMNTLVSNKKENAL